MHSDVRAGSCTAPVTVTDDGGYDEDSTATLDAGGTRLGTGTYTVGVDDPSFYGGPVTAKFDLRK